MPDPPRAPIRIVVPAALQMGWTESPSYFCTATETARDIIQGLVADKAELPPHCLEEYMRPAKSAKHSKSDSPGHGRYVYVDDFMGAAVENKDGTLLGPMTPGMLHGIHSVFPPTAVTGHISGKDPISLEKVQQGNGQWHHQKEKFGFELNGNAKTVQISEAKSTHIIHEIRRILKRKKVQLKRYCHIIVKL
jgi:hypothetical protein